MVILAATWITQLQIVGQVAFAGLLGGIIGAEREWAGKAAGLRTHMFVCAASALFMLLGRDLMQGFGESEHMIQTDPIRVMQSIVLGISFLGAGTIIRQGRDRIEGLTTAASILLVAGIGIAVAMREHVTASAVTTLMLLVLIVFGYVERHFLRPKRSNRNHKPRE